MKIIGIKPLIRPPPPPLQRTYKKIVNILIKIVNVTLLIRKTFGIFWYQMKTQRLWITVELLLKPFFLNNKIFFWNDEKGIISPVAHDDGSL